MQYSNKWWVQGVHLIQVFNFLYLNICTIGLTKILLEITYTVLILIEPSQSDSF